MPQTQIDGLTVNPLAVETTTAKFDLTLSLENTPSGLIGTWEYNTDLFDAATIARMARHFQTLLEGIVANPTQQVSQLPLLTEAERHQLLVEWNNTTKEYPEDKCIHQLFEEQVERNPDAIAVVFEDKQLTYRELNQRANTIAHHLQRLGVGPEVLVGICVERSLEMVGGLLGILKAGGAYVPLDPAYPQERLALMLEDAKVPVLLTQETLVAKLPSHQTHLVCLDTDWSAISQETDKNPVSGATPENLAYVIYTSGSTGKPKGVQICHQSVTNFLDSIRLCVGLTQKDIFLAITTICFDMAIPELYLPFMVGGQVVLVSREVASDGKQLLEKLVHSRATAMIATPATWNILLMAGWQGNPQMKILCGADALPRKLATELIEKGACVWNLYGPTETTVCLTAYKLQDKQLIDLPKETVGLIGRPFTHNTSIYILDPHLQPVPIGVPGELFIGGVGVARGYLNRPDLTEEKFIANPFEKSKVKSQKSKGSRLYKTGDLARYLPDGNIEFLGRIDNQVKIRGFRIELGEIENAMSQHPQVFQAIVIAREANEGFKQLVAYVVPQQEKPSPSTLRSFLKQKLPSYMVPAAFVVLESLPRTDNGKVDRRALPAPDKSSFLDESFVPPRTQIELQLAQIWSDLLNVQPVGIKDNFFDLGGHSLVAVRLMVKIEQEFGKSLPISTLFQFPTIEDLALHLLTEKDAPTPSSLVPIQPIGNKTPWFCVHPVGGDILCYADLAHHFGDTQPFWALRSPGLDGECEPLTRIEDMAATYIKALQTIQPEGPYQLGGWSMGGLVAFEIATQLVASRHHVSLLALIDSYAPTQKFKDSLEMDEAILVAEWVENLSGLSGKALSVSVEKLRLLEPQEQLNYVLEQAKEEGLLPKEMRQKQSNSLFKVFKANRLSVHSYSPQPYPGRITLFCAGEESQGENLDPTLGWGELAMGDINMHIMKSDHFSIIRTTMLAELLKAYL